MSVLGDREARATISGELSRTMLVEAGAGAGKTRELVARVINLVASGVPVTSIAAITFTEKAAAELRDRIREGLEAEDDERCREALDVLDEAPIQTLHGFAQRLLGAHAMAAGLPPVFEVVDEIDASIDFDRRWGPFLDDLLSLPEYAELMTTAWSLRCNVNRLRDLARQFHDHWDQLKETSLPRPPLAVPDLTPLLRALDAALAARSGCNLEGDGLRLVLDGPISEARTQVAALMTSGSLVRVAQMLTGLPRLAAGRGGVKTNWRTPSKDEVIRLVTEAADARNQALRELAVPVLYELCALVRAFVLRGVQSRQAAGRLEFHDLLVLARDLLRDHQSVRNEVRGDIRYLLVDEFQDTDPLQVELAVLIGGSSDGAPAWPEAPVGSGRLFFVGDPKQSIYRFRRADIALYQRVRDRFAPELVELRHNFRSVPSLLEWVNEVFEGLIGAGGPGQVGWVALEPSRPDISEEAAVVLLGGPAGPGEVLARVREVESADVARACRRMVGEEWTVHADGTPRAAAYDDIAVLLPTRMSLPALERALDEAEVPYRVESRALLWSTQEVSDLLAVVGAADDPSDQVALVAALRSPILGCTDRELVEWRAAGGHWNALRAVPEGVGEEHAVTQAMAYLRHLHHERWRIAPSVLVDQVINQRGVMEMAFGRRRQRESWHRVRFLLDQARAFADAGGASLRHFVDWAQRQADEEAGAVETVVPEADDRAVRILTVHGAKGLEFPIVVLAGLNSAPRRYRPAEVLWPEGLPPEVSIGTRELPWHTPGYLARRDSEIAMEQQEAVRLLYVACTRARDHLVVSLHHKPEAPGPAGCLAARLLPHAEAAARLARRLGVEEPGSRSSGVSAAPGEGGSASFDGPGLATWQAERQALVQRLGAAPAVSATALAEAGTDPSEAAPLDPAAEEGLAPWQRGRAGSAFGRAVHAVLQSVDLSSGEGVDGLAQAQAVAEGIPSRAVDVARSAHAALGSPAVRAAVASRHWREVYVAAEVDGVIVEGYIDLLYEGPEGLVVVDYKTDAVGGEGLDRAVARYRPQLAAYALALEGALHRPVARAELVFARPGGAQQRTVDRLDDAIADIRRRVRAVAGAG